MRLHVFTHQKKWFFVMFMILFDTYAGIFVWMCCVADNLGSDPVRVGRRFTQYCFIHRCCVVDLARVRPRQSWPPFTLQMSHSHQRCLKTLQCILSGEYRDLPWSGLCIASSWAIVWREPEPESCNATAAHFFITSIGAVILNKGSTVW